MNEEELNILAKEVWNQIKSAYHWGDEFTIAYLNLLNSLRTAAKKGYKE